MPPPARLADAGSTLLVHLSALVVVLALPGQVWFRVPAWSLDAEAIPQILVMGLAHAVAALAPLPTPATSGRRVPSVLATVAGAYLLAYGFQALRPDLPFSRGMLMLAAGASCVILVGRAWASAERRTLYAASVHVTASILLVVGLVTAPPAAAESDAAFVRTAYHPLQVVFHDSVIAPDDEHTGGAIRLVGEQVVALTGTGAFYALERAGQEVTGRRLPIPPPVDLDAFDAAVPPRVSREGFRAIDFASRATDTGWEVFVSHDHWVPDRACLVVRVSRLDLDQTLTPLARPGRWQSVFDSRPCLTVVEHDRRPPLAAIASGGRLAWTGEDRLLLTVGDMELPGLAQQDSADYGKTISIDVRTGAAEHFTHGHRVSQGLWVDADGSEWATEHGPMGGDELNLLRQGGNYGWPLETYGTEYGHYAWRSAAARSAPPGTIAPVYSWLPSVGVSSLIRLEGRAFEAWAGDLLAASLKQQSLYRLRVEDGRVVYAEPIRIGMRIRDLVEDSDGTLWLWGEDVIATVEPGGEHQRGAEMFAICAECHLVEDFSGALGPTLWGVVGSRVADREDFDYSEALRALGGRWTEERLDAFLEAPDVFAPGTTMYFPGLSDPADRAAVIAHLKELAR